MAVPDPRRNDQLRTVRAHGLRIMSGRDPYEQHRVATPLELLYDLTFAVAFAVAGEQFAHLLAEGHFGPRSRPFSGRRSIWTCGSRWSRSGSATRSSSTGLASDSSGRHGLGGERLGSSPRPTSWALNRSMLSIAVIA